MAEFSGLVVFDNKTLKSELVADWGFACVIWYGGKTMLFDTGANGTILIENMKKLGVDPGEIEVVALSHAHWDHANGLGVLLESNNHVMVYLPESFPESYKSNVRHFGVAVKDIAEGGEILEGVFTTGEMHGIIPEQALAFRTTKGTVIITGCAHPGIVNIVQTAKEVAGTGIHLVLGGFHSPPESVVDRFIELGVQKVAPCHCSGAEAMKAFKESFGDNFVEVGVGKELTV
ncbi:MAG: MBL fold metallo-hydrolase [Dehalococcoidia bacterium]